MKLFLISQSVNRGYDTFDSAVVCAPDAETAQKIDLNNPTDDISQDWTEKTGSTWAHSPDQVTVTYLGEASPAFTEVRVICASFNAG